MTEGQAIKTSHSWEVVCTGFESLARLLASYAILLLMVLLTAVAITQWDSPYSHAEPDRLELRVGRPKVKNPVEVAASLANEPLISSWDSHLSEAPVWFSINIPGLSATPALTRKLEFPSRHAMWMKCFNGLNGQDLGEAERYSSGMNLLLRKTGFVLKLPGGDPVQIVCEAGFVGPAHLTALLWSNQGFETSLRSFDRTLGLLDGALTLIALFLLLTALINRRLLYAVFAAWLLLAMRLGSLSLGLDLMWLGYEIPASFLSLSRAMTIAFYSVALLTLYRELFREELVGTRYGTIMRSAQGITLVLVVASVALPYRYFLPIVWPVGGLILIAMCASLFDIVRRTRSRVALWYSGALAVSAFATLGEIWAAASGQRELIGYANSVTAAIASCLLVSLALAEQIRQEHLQRLSAQAELQHTFEATPVGLFTLDMEGNFLSANPALRRMIHVTNMGPGREPTNWSQHFEAGTWLQLLDLAAKRDDSYELEVSNGPLRQGGPARRFLVKAIEARGKLEGSLQDVTERSVAAENLQFLVNHDPLTKVLNRRGVEEAVRDGLSRLPPGDNGSGLAVAYLDLDRFRLLNELFGHSAGDEVLRQVCKRIQAEISYDMQFGRVGADEFMIVMTNVSMAEAESLARRLLAAMGSLPYQTGEQTFNVRVSIGVVEASRTLSIQEVLLTANRACQQAKAGSRGNGLVVFDRTAAIFTDHAQELQLIAELAAGSIVDRLSLAMQPVMSLQAPEDSLNFEVLLRMHDKNGNAVPTFQVIQAAESSGHIGVIDRWVLTTTLAWMEAHHTWLSHTQFVCVNLSGASLNDERFLSFVFDLLAKSPVSAGRLCFEITESVALHDLDNTRRFIEQARSHGARVALDDFGAGYTSFAYLRELPADVLKIDGNFVVNMNAHPANIAIVEAIVSLARNLGMKTIAEWAEDAETVRTLAGLGVDYVQGFVVAQPQQPEDLLAAASAAAFIEDPEMRVVLEELKKRTVVADSINLFEDPSDPPVH
jgi:diguanylate cyclase (GGDEF)-like protein